ncbi:MAG TPA: hypothetical protein VKY54_12770 [Kiloniellales bacterium]|jgi:hypothetical protein|nr:hypothetical protein [Kiloniellales bacterium]
MPILRSLLFTAVKRAAMDPRVRAEAIRVYRDRVHPHALQAARQGRGAAEQFRHEWRATAAEIDPRRDPSRFAGRLVRRLRQQAKNEPEV